MFRIYGPDDAPGLPVPPSKRQIRDTRAVITEHLSDQTLEQHADEIDALSRTAVTPQEILRRWRDTGL